MNFRYINLHTNYDYKLVSVNKDNLNQEDKFWEISKSIKYTGACYHKFFNNMPNYLKSHCKMDISVYTTAEKHTKDSSNNFMMISQEQLDWYLGYLNSVVPFTYKKTMKADGLMTLSVEMLDNTHFENKWLISSIRNIYEFPQSWALKEALELKNMGYFPEEENIINVMNVILRGKVVCFYDQYVCSFNKTDGPIRLTTDQVRENLTKLSKMKTSTLNSIYPKEQYDQKYIDYLAVLYSGFNGYIINMFEEDPEEVFSPMNLKMRYNLIYNKIYKKA